MRLTLALFLTLASVMSANASIQFFFTHSDGPYGLSGLDLDTGLPEPGFDPFLPTWGTGSFAPSDYVHGYNLKDVDGSGATDTADVPNVADLTPVTLQPGDWAWVWLRFTPDEMLGNYITGIQDIGFRQGGQFERVDLTSYYCNDVDRWFPVGLDEFTQNPQNLFGSNITNQVPHDAMNLYVGGENGADYRHTTLLSAIRCTPESYGTVLGTVTSLFTFGYVDPRPVEFLNTIQSVPEPAAALIGAILVLGLHRRR